MRQRLSPELPLPRHRPTTLTAALALLVSAISFAPAQDSEAPTGVALTFETLPTGDAPPGRDARLSRLLALRVARGSPPTPFLPARPFRASWEGFLEIEFFDDYTFRLEGAGKASLEIDGKPVMAVESLAETSTEDVTVELDEGLRPFVLRYESPVEGDAVFLASWSSFDFTTEPIPPAALRHDPDHELLRARTLVRVGRELFASRQCSSCHRTATDFAGGMPELAESAADLTGIGSRLNAGWMARWIEHPRRERPEATMPRVFSGAESTAPDARSLDVAAFLATLVDPDAPAGGLDGAAVARGKKVFLDTGCLGCHVEPGEEPLAEDDDRVGLTHVAHKWQPAALVRFLEDPAANSTSIRMPDLALRPTEARDVAAYLIEATDAGANNPPTPKGDPTRGRELFQTSGCRSCHQLDVDDEHKAPALGELLVSEVLDKGCLGSGPAPDFGFTDSEVAALQAFLREGTASLARVDAVEYTEREVQRLRCEACHQRDGRIDRWTRVSSGGASQEEIEAALAEAAAAAGGTGEANAELLQIRPRLTWVGEKLRPEWLAQFLVDPAKDVVRPWLLARMPRFAGDARLLARGFAAEHALPDTSPALAPVRQELVAAGAQLVKETGGLTCEKCHDFGDQVATSVFDAKGPDLFRAPTRLRRDFYARWLLNPQRIDPGSKMPQFATDGETAITDVLEGDAARQFAAIWEYIKQGASLGSSRGAREEPRLAR